MALCQSYKKIVILKYLDTKLRSHQGNEGRIEELLFSFGNSADRVVFTSGMCFPSRIKYISDKLYLRMLLTCRTKIKFACYYDFCWMWGFVHCRFRRPRTNLLFTVDVSTLLTWFLVLFLNGPWMYGIGDGFCGVAIMPFLENKVSFSCLSKHIEALWSCQTLNNWHKLNYSNMWLFWMAFVSANALVQPA